MQQILLKFIKWSSLHKIVSKFKSEKFYEIDPSWFEQKLYNFFFIFLILSFRLDSESGLLSYRRFTRNR